jgi:hypothetical protein
MRSTFLMGLAGAWLAGGVVRAQGDSVPTRQWSPMVITAGVSVGTRSIPDNGAGQTTGTTFLGFGVRFHDFGGLIYELRKPVSGDGERFVYYLATAELYPLYRQGSRGLRVSVSLGKASITARPFVGGHSSERIDGYTTAWGIGLSQDARAGFFVLTPYAGVLKATRAGLQTTHCSTPNYLSGDFTQVCFDGPSGSFDIMQLGLAIGLR